MPPPLSKTFTLPNPTLLGAGQRHTFPRRKREGQAQEAGLHRAPRVGVSGETSHPPLSQREEDGW